MKKEGFDNFSKLYLCLPKALKIIEDFSVSFGVYLL